MKGNIQNHNLFEAELYDFFYLLEKNRQKNTLSTILIETIKIVASILFTFVIQLISVQLEFEELTVSFGATILFTIIYAILQFFSFASKKLQDMLYNKRSRIEMIKISEFLFHKVANNYLSIAFNTVDFIENNSDLDECSRTNYIKIAIKYFQKAKDVFADIIPYEESRNHGRREKANAVFLSNIGYTELKMCFKNAENQLNNLLILTDAIYVNEISEVLTYFQTVYPRITALEKIFDCLID